ncbi:CAP domain-containing protein [Ancylomarina longa]|uniref:CAP domain-containing protein n=1 Tax=Ancylomarina longa TaxID=2487017 RepID=A0A434AES3_9BACT|nr:CAP domain-containing protein [Ancylomarina longa]
MSSNNFFSHISSDGSNLSDRLAEENYGYLYAGENIASEYSIEESVMDAWLKSSRHCVNIMNANFTEMGAGRIGDYWTQDFAKPK